jgi:hypothetical protein
MKDLRDATQAEVFIRSIDRLCSSIQDLRTPVIAVIEGPCMGAGMEVAASCDVRIAVDGPKTAFAMPETKIGIPSVVQASLIPGLIGWGRARQLLYFGGQITASRALTIGFVNELTSPTGLPEVLANWEQMVDEAEPNAVSAQKALMKVMVHSLCSLPSLSCSNRPGSTSEPVEMASKQASKYSDSRLKQISRKIRWPSLSIISGAKHNQGDSEETLLKFILVECRIAERLCISKGSTSSTQMKSYHGSSCRLLSFPGISYCC